jgi:hypothetical protein
MLKETIEFLYGFEGARSYRVKYGHKRLGIVTTSPLLALAEIAEECAVDIPALLRTVRVDSMGRDSIIYWPQIAAPEDKEADE